MRGWLKPPKVSRNRLILAAVIVLVTIPFAYFRILNAFPELKTVRTGLLPLIGKTQFGLLRYVHFLATAYLGWVVVGPMGSRIKNWGRAQIVVNTIRKVGQQSLAVFVSSLVLAQLLGGVFKTIGTHWSIVMVGNLVGFAALIAIAHSVAWFKSQPWRKLPAIPNPQLSASISSGHSASLDTTSNQGATILPSGIPARKID